MKASITRLDTRLKALESAPDQLTTRDSAKQLSLKLKESGAEFKTAHLSLIDLIDDEDTLATEQAALDEHDDIIAFLDLCIQALINSINSSTATKVDDRKILSRHYSSVCLPQTRQLALCQVKKRTSVDSSSMMNNCVTIRGISLM